MSVHNRSAVKQAEAQANAVQSHSNKFPTIGQWLTPNPKGGYWLDISPFDPKAPRTQNPIFNTQIQGGTTSGTASQNFTDYMGSIFGTPGDWAKAAEGWCGPIPFPCWQVGIAAGAVLLLLILVK